MPSNKWTGCCPTRGSTSMPRFDTGLPMSYDLAPKSKWRWTGPISTPTARRPYMLSLLTRHGRATPLVWLTVETATLKNHRNEYEYQALVRLADALPADIKVCIVADRGFGDQKLYRFLTEQLKFDYVIRFRGNITVTSADGDVRTAAGWVGPGGRATLLRGALVTADKYQLGTVLCVRDKDMKQAWCLETN